AADGQTAVRGRQGPSWRRGSGPRRRPARRRGADRGGGRHRARSRAAGRGGQPAAGPERQRRVFCAPALRCHTERGGARPDDHRRERRGPGPVGAPGPTMTRRVLVLTHPGRPAAAHTAELVATELRRHSMTPIGEEEIDGGEIELAIVLGGDGTIW